MAKLLTIGVAYNPKTNCGVDGEGKKIFHPCVTFFFNCDARTSNVVYGSGMVKNVRVNSDGALMRTVKVEDYKKFIYGKKALPNILSALEKVGDYVYDTTKLGELEQAVETEIANVANSERSSKLQLDRGAFIDDIMSALEKNINDPKFIDYLNSIGAIRRFDDKDYEKIISFSALNNAMILTQWLKSGHQGYPRFLATTAQWRNFNRRPLQTATPLYAIKPAGTEKDSKSGAMSRAGVDKNTYNSNAMSRLVVRKFRNDKRYGEANNNDGTFSLGSPYYDYSETELIPGMQDVYDFSDNTSISTNINPNATSGDDITRFDSLRDKDKDSSTHSPAQIIKNVEEFANKYNETELITLCKRGNIERIIDYLVDKSDTIKRLRGKNYNGSSYRANDIIKEKKKREIYSALTKALVLLRFGINPQAVQSIIGKYMSEIKTTNGYNQNAFSAIISDFQNIYFVMTGVLLESFDANLFIWGLNNLGISVEEYKNMPEDEEEADAELNNIRETFRRKLSKLL